MRSAFGWYSDILDAHTSDEVSAIFSLAFHPACDSCRRTDQTISLPTNSTLVCIEALKEDMKLPTFGWHSDVLDAHTNHEAPATHFPWPPKWSVTILALSTNRCLLFYALSWCVLRR
jgi:hypothetical protein